MGTITKAKKIDLVNLCEECGIDVPEKVTIPALIKLIKGSEDYDEDFMKDRIEVIMAARQAELEEKKEKEKLQAELEEKKLQVELEEMKLQAEERKWRLEMEERDREREFELRKLQMQETTKEHVEVSSRPNPGKQYDLLRLLNKFDNSSDVDLYLSMYERQMVQAGIDKKEWVSYLINLMPLDIVNIINRENEPEVHDYDHIKGILLKRYKLSPEEFRQKFFSRKKETSANWRDFAYEIKVYFQQWVEGLKINDYEGLSELIIVDQIRHKLPTEIKERFAEDLLAITKVNELVNKLDVYETARRVCGKPTAGNKESNLDDKKLRPTNYANFENRQTGNRYSVNRERNESQIVCFGCNRPGHVISRCTARAPQQECNPRRDQGSWREPRSGAYNPNQGQDMQPKTVYIGTSNGKKPRIVDTNGIKANLIIDTGSEISIASKKYYEAINSPELTKDHVAIVDLSKEFVRPKGFFFHKVYVDGVEVQDTFYVVEDSDYDLIIGQKAVEGLILKMADGDARIISSSAVQVGYTEISEIQPETNEINAADGINHSRDLEDMTGIECVNSEVDLMHIADVTNRGKVRRLIENYEPRKTKDTGLKMKIILVDEKPVRERPRRFPLVEQQIINGRVERIHRSMIPVLSKWYKYVPKVQRIMNSAITRSTKYSPFELMTGVKMKDSDMQDIKRILDEEYSECMMKGREAIKGEAKKNILRVREENRVQFNRKRKTPKKYKTGDLVAIKRTRFGNVIKLKEKYLGPYQVTAAKRRDRYDVEKIGEHHGPRKTSTGAEYMKPWAAN